MTTPSATLVIAEIGSVHDGSFGNALRLIDLAKGCGADAVKFQTHIADAESLPDAPDPPYFSEEKRMDYFRRTAFNLDQWRRLIAHAHDQDITFLSSPFSTEAVELLETVGLPMYKIPSGEVTNLPLLQRVSETGKPTILSSGMSSWTELDEAVNTLRALPTLSILQCTSAYPCPLDRVGLNVLSEMADRYHLPVGLSDHTLGTSAAIAAVLLGASIIEKHLTFSRSMYGSDAAHSMEPADFALLVQAIRDAEVLRSGTVDKNDIEPYTQMRHTFQKSMVSVHPLRKGQCLQAHDICFKKPGDGIGANRAGEWLERSLARDIPANHKFVTEDFE